MKLPTLSVSERAEVKRDLSVFVAALLATGVLDGKSLTLSALTAAIVTAAKVSVRAIFPTVASYSEADAIAHNAG